MQAVLSDSLHHALTVVGKCKELAADLERRRQLQLKVAMIEAREQEERARHQQLEAPQPGPSEALPSPHASAPPLETQVKPSLDKTEPDVQHAYPKPEAKPSAANPWQNAPSSDEPLPWSPRTMRRA